VMESHKRRGLEARALLLAVGAQICSPWPGCNCHASLVGARGKAHLAVGIETDRAQVAFGEAVDPDHVGAGLDELLAAERNRHLADMRGFEQPADVLMAAENRRLAVVALVASHPFKDGQPVMQA